MEMKHFKAMDDDSNNVDVFNRLTSSLLVLIVSYLPFREAARTCILSKQWVDVWRETTNLEFNENFFVKPEETKENQMILRNSFIDFVRQFVAQYPQKGIQRFALACSDPQAFLSDIRNFVVFAISRNVRELELDFSDPTWREDSLDSHQPAFELPLQIYQHKRLVLLKLFSCRFDASRFTNFSTLKSVSLGWTGISVVSIKALLVNCPLIESLSLKKCWDLEHFEISLPNLRLKNLVLDNCNFIQDWFCIEGPKLEFLKYSGRIGHFHMSNQRNMVEADLDFGMEPEFDDVGSLLYDFLQEFYAVQILTVCSVLLQIIPQGDEPFGLQSPLNVRHLILKAAVHFNEYFGIRFMLRSCPHLEILTFDIGPAKIFPDYAPPFRFNPHEFWSKDLRIQRCIRSSLKVVNVKGFRGTLSELYVLRYIICFGDQLRELNLYVANEEGENGENRDTYMERVELLLKFIKRHQQLHVSVFL
ncbi:F-box protein At3g62230 [Ricinus communis]|uniref:F-box protein At3g62230 n=1 Tax=Ricinus communis TaxID=3988 RepID=UPI00201A9910|nr:F-box protein At3g62230 [Ricinus communis]